MAVGVSGATFGLQCYSAPVPLVVTCAQCREEVLDAGQIGDDGGVRTAGSPPDMPTREALPRCPADPPRDLALRHDKLLPEQCVLSHETGVIAHDVGG